MHQRPARAATRASRTTAPCPRRQTPSARDRIRRPKRRRSSPECRRRSSRARRTAATVSSSVSRDDAEIDRRRRLRRAPARASAKLLEETIWPGPGSTPGGTSSSPVANSATFGRRCTGTSGWFMPAASARSRAVSRRPAASSTSPAREVEPLRRGYGGPWPSASAPRPDRRRAWCFPE